MTKSKKVKNEEYYSHLDPEITPDHNAEITGKKFEVEKDIERDKKIDPVKVFSGFKGKKPNKKLDKLNDKNKKKILSVEKNIVNSKAIKYGL